MLHRIYLYILGALLWGCVLWLSGFAYFILSVTHTHNDTKTVVDGIVVLTGGQGRIAKGVELYKNGLGKTLFISGVHKGVNAKDLAEKQNIEASMIPYLKNEQLGYFAKDTIGNATEIANWIKEGHISSIRLVTADYHLMRSQFEILQQSPHLLIIPDPVLTIHTLNKPALNLLWGEYIKLTVRWINHIISKY